MIEIIKRLTLGILLIFAASAVLLLSTTEIKQGNYTQKRFAIFQHMSMSTLDDTVQGIQQGLKENGYENGKNIAIDLYNAENDTAAAKTISRNIINKDYDIVFTVGTPALQAFAQANTKGKCIQVFSAVTDPYNAGVGITGDSPQDHPVSIVGLGTFQPVEKAFVLAKLFSPDLKKVGIVWNPAEDASKACTMKARMTASKIGIELVEVNASKPADLHDAVGELAAKGVDAIYVGADSISGGNISKLIKEADKKQIAVFSCVPEDTIKGAVFSIGPNYTEVGRLAAKLAYRVLNGTSPAELAVKNIVPERISVNELSKDKFKTKWDFPQDKITSIKRDLEESNKNLYQLYKIRDKLYKIGIVYYGPDPATDRNIEGIKAALAANGFNEGENLQILKTHAKSEASNIIPIMQSLINSDVDAIVPITTPCLSAACSTVKNKPVVFSSVYDPIAAGAGISLTEHLPNVTGAGSMPPLKETVDMIKALAPGIKKIGTIYNSSEINARASVSSAKTLFKLENIELIEQTIASPNNIYDAARTLIGKNVEMIWITGDNTMVQCMDTIAKFCEKAKIPLVLNDNEQISCGALAGCGISFYKAGLESGSILARVLKGESPENIPISALNTARIAINLEKAADLNYKIPHRILVQADVLLGLNKKYGGPAKIALVRIARGPLLDSVVDGIYSKFDSMGMIKNLDYTVTEYCAEGESANLPLIMNTVQNENFDVLITHGTPTLIAAAKYIKNIPVVFTMCSDPQRLGIFPMGEKPSGITGVHDDPPIKELIELAEATELKKIKTIGTLWDPAQPNSEISVNKLRKICKEQKIKLSELPVNKISELPDAVMAICEKNIDILVLSADNITISGFPAIYSKTSKNGIPVYTTEPGLIAEGAKGAIGDDYFAWGRQSARLAAVILAGVQPSEIPFQKTAQQKRLVKKKETYTK